MSCGAFKQTKAKLGFELLNATADRWLRHIEVLRSAVKTQRIRHGQKIAQLG